MVAARGMAGHYERRVYLCFTGAQGAGTGGQTPRYRAKRMSTRNSSPIDLIRRLTEVGFALSSEKDSPRLLELILQNARELTNADGGTLYSTTDEGQLRFENLFTESLGIHLGGTSGKPIKLPPLDLYDEDGQPNNHMVAARAAVTAETVNIPDAYASEDFDFSGTREFDRKAGYRSTSFLTVPMRNHEDVVIGVLQLINARDVDGHTVIPFTEEDQGLVESLASQAAISLTNKRLIDEQRVLFESFIELMANAIDDKSPYTGGHCRRVPELTLMLADAMAKVEYGPLRDFSMSGDDRYELQIAGWLHDCGKVTTPEYVVDKATKLETIFDRIALVETRVALLKQQLENQILRAQLEGAAADEATMECLAELDADLDFLRTCNVGSEAMSDEAQARVQRIADYRYTDSEGEEQPLLSENEVYNLTVVRGTLTAEERKVINYHITATIKMLESLPYPRHLSRVPEFAGGHHEHMDGTGYPKGLTGSQMSVQARAMGIADIFEALTAGDRPYKKAMPLSLALTILGRMKEDQHIDPDLFDIFVREKIYLQYAEKFLQPDQIDAVDHGSIPGFSP